MLYTHMTSKQSLRDIIDSLKIIDATTIGLCLSLFDWVKFRKTKGGIKLHVLFDVKAQIHFVDMSTAKKHDINEAHHMPIGENTIYVLDKGLICSLMVTSGLFGAPDTLIHLVPCTPNREKVVQKLFSNYEKNNLQFFTGFFYCYKLRIGLCDIN